MQNFQFSNPTKIIFGKGEIKRLPKEIPSNSKVLVIYGGGSVKKTGLLETIKEVLKDYQLGEFGGIEPNPTYETLMKAVELIRKENYDFLLAVGGGSVIDGTKFIAAAVPFTQGDPWELVEKHLPIDTALPFATVLTLPATGSEMNNGAVITRKALQAKLPFFSPVTFPRFSILDPIYTYTLPNKQIANGVVDAFVHVMEQYLTYPVAGKVQDRFAEGLLLTLVEEGPIALQDPENYDVRANIMWTATLALNGLIGSGVPQDWSTHMVGHEITALYGLDHAQTLAIVLPSMLEVMKEEKAAKLLQYSERIWNIDINLSPAEKIELAIEKTRNFFETMGVRTRLSDYGLGEETIEKIIAGLKAHGMVKLGEKGTVTTEVVRQVLALSL
ncbi:iron-containing alcohol dehydrogenase [Pelosinus sp. UFO1]|uniref:iron-containing alcohol dehydrogenase n=1 Tax=Pelosinus sp. UFO1 TaxID=484770 RepID=UPI0004D17095|nr:iron-containing alcohol dehydrogenase [Pelosinus sp. UFO1]AIF49862.1 Alcohol dehydrogenase (NADP(+)) [Pelosinus sp. UFO1]